MTKNNRRIIGWLFLTMLFSISCSATHQSSINDTTSTPPKDLLSYDRLIVGTWRDNNSIATYNADGTRSTVYDNGDESWGRWRIQGDILFDTIHQYRKKNRRIWQHHAEYKMKILNINREKYMMRHEHDGSIWKATRIETLQ